MPEPVTIGDLITAIATDNASIAADQAAVANANKLLADDTAKLASDTSAFNSALAAIGSTYHVNPDGTATVYIFDATSGSYHSALAKPDTTPLPVPAPPVEPVSG